MEQLLASCDQAANFPRNLIHHDAYEHTLRAYVQRLNKRQLDLFQTEKDAGVDLIDFDAQTQRSLSKTGVSLGELKDYTHKDALASNAQLPQRFVFLTGANSRDRLYISRQLLTYILSYHQVMPSFLDFLFVFGRQAHARDLHFSGFRQESRLEPQFRRLEIPELGRSGRELRMCYNLKSVEPSEYQPDMPWSIRQTAVYHSLDLETGRAFWVIVKGDELIKERIQDSLEQARISRQVEGLYSTGNAFATSLTTHMVICDWCNEYWRWYISCLEEMLRSKTGHSLSLMLDNPQSPDTRNLRKVSTKSAVSHSFSEKKWWPNITSKKPPTSDKQSFKGSTGPLLGFSPPPGSPPGPPPGFNTLTSGQSLPASANQHSFADFQDAQRTGDRVNEALLVLESNISVLIQIQEHYHTVSQSEHCAKELDRDCRIQLERFEKRITGITNELRMQQSRAAALLQLVSDRKDLLTGILGIQNMKANYMLALRAQESQKNMELATKDMHILALKTKSETVSMRIITLVTLFFLPGTFISTIMSTDIVRFQLGNDGETQKLFQIDALQLFLAICLPLMVVVFVAWYGVYWWVDQKEAEERRLRLLDTSEEV